MVARLPTTSTSKWQCESVKLHGFTHGKKNIEMVCYQLNSLRLSRLFQALPVRLSRHAGVWRLFFSRHCFTSATMISDAYVQNPSRTSDLVIDRSAFILTIRDYNASARKDLYLQNTFGTKSGQGAWQCAGSPGCLF